MGRAAMLGVAFAIVGEILTGSGPLAQLGYEVRSRVPLRWGLQGGSQPPAHALEDRRTAQFRAAASCAVEGCAGIGVRSCMQHSSLMLPGTTAVSHSHLTPLLHHPAAAAARERV